MDSHCQTVNAVRPVSLTLFSQRETKCLGQFVIRRNEELCDVYISAGVVRVVKCRRLGWAGCVARMGVT
jgi:hypothetical protein